MVEAILCVQYNITANVTNQADPLKYLYGRPVKSPCSKSIITKQLPRKKKTNRLVVQNLKIARNKKFFPKLFKQKTTKRSA